MNTVRHLPVTLFLLLAVAPAISRAQAPCPPAPNGIDIEVDATITFDPTTHLFTYRYTVASAPASQQEVADFALDFASPISSIASPEGWTSIQFAERNTRLWFASEADPLPEGEPDTGQVPPGKFQIAPGASLTGFTFQSPHGPGPVNFYARGYVGLPGGASEEEAEQLLEDCPASTGGFFDLAVTGTTEGPVDFLPVQIDVKPGGSPNSINPRAQGEIPVGVLSSATFDATSVDVASARFGPAGAPESFGRTKVEDVNGDSRADLVLHFATQATGIACGDTSVELIGSTLAGTPIRGSDTVVTVGCRP